MDWKCLGWGGEVRRCSQEVRGEERAGDGSGRSSDDYVEN
jgi:hypothetical protein